MSIIVLDRTAPQQCVIILMRITMLPYQTALH